MTIALYATVGMKSKGKPILTSQGYLSDLHLYNHEDDYKMEKPKNACGDFDTSAQIYKIISSMLKW